MGTLLPTSSTRNFSKAVVSIVAMTLMLTSCIGVPLSVDPQFIGRMALEACEIPVGSVRWHMEPDRVFAVGPLKTATYLFTDVQAACIADFASRNRMRLAVLDLE